MGWQTAVLSCSQRPGSGSESVIGITSSEPTQQPHVGAAGPFRAPQLRGDKNDTQNLGAHVPHQSTVSYRTLWREIAASRAPLDTNSSSPHRNRGWRTSNERALPKARSSTFLTARPLAKYLRPDCTWDWLPAIVRSCFLSLGKRLRRSFPPGRTFNNAA